MITVKQGRVPVWLAAVVLLLAGCGQDTSRLNRTDIPAEKLFTQLPPSYTGIDFENRLTDTDAYNVFTYRNYYNGGGIGIGDLNGDSLPDIYLTANQHPNRLYLNRGDWRFEDVTDQAGVAGQHAWSTGVSIVDVNGDGLLDIYVCNAGNIEGDDRANELFVNNGVDKNGVPTFTERAAEYGIDDDGLTTHAVFFDYDRDGDLDLYVLNNSHRPVSSFGLRNIRHERNHRGGDRLYRNDGERFVDVSEEAGILGSEIAFGLGVSVGDVNRDGWLDLYISNDFFERDYLYLNDGDGTFSEALEQQMPSISLSSMGADVADVNNDGYPDIYVTDMLPDLDRRLKTTSSYEGWRVYQAKLENGFWHQFMRNTLQLNNGNGTFSEIGQIAGVSATDWSWGALVADFNLDGHKDIFVANGVYKDVTDQDFITFFAQEINQAARSGRKSFDYLELLEHIPSEPLSNYLFANNGDLTFTNMASAWGLDTPSFSNGAAYGDLDNDGDLDLVVNNINQKAFVYRNETDALLGNRYLRIRLVGEGANRFGIGARVTIRDDSTTYYLEQVPNRGFQSSVEYVLTAGVGRADTVDAVVVEWPDDRFSVLTDVPTNQVLTVRQSDATETGIEITPVDDEAEPIFEDVTDEIAPEYEHRENAFVDFLRDGLIPKMLSTEGPHIAVGDANGDGRDDVFIGGAKESPGRLFVQQPDGRFVSTNEALFEQDKISEDVGAVFFDADGDGDQDLYVVSGGNEYSDLAPALKDRLYVNDGRGRFTKAEDRLPSLYLSGSRAVPADFDGDGDIDLFVGGRVIPWKYGLNPESVLLENDGRGRFRNVTDELAPELGRVGMVTDAAWSDYDGDGLLDLFVVGEWMPITVFRNTGRRAFEKVTPQGLEKSHGWWNRLVMDDFDGDGDQDFVAGNLGLNTKIHANASEPATMHVHDFDGNGSIEQIISTYNDGASYPIHLRNDLIAQLPFLKSKYPRFADYAEQSVDDMFTPDQLREAVVKHAYELRTSYIENLGDGTFRMMPLPFEAQVAPVYGIASGDFDGDGRRDLLLAGNFYGVKPDLGRMDAGYGLFLKGDGAGGFDPVPARKSGLVVAGQCRDIQVINHVQAGNLVLVARNDDALLAFGIR